MRKKSTRLLSAALAVCMMLSVLPVGAFAAEPGAEEQENGASAQADPVGSEFVEINDTNFRIRFSSSMLRTILIKQIRQVRKMAISVRQKEMQ